MNHLLNTMGIMVLIALLLSLNLFSFSQTELGDSLTSVYEQGVAAYRDKDYQGAIEHFETVLTKEPRNAAALTNLALSYYQVGEAGYAIAYFRKALEISPGLDPAQEGLNFVLSDLHLQPTHTGTFDQLIDRYIRPIPISLALIVFAGLLLATGWSLLTYLGKRRRFIREQSAPPGLPVLGITLSLMLCVFSGLLIIKFIDAQKSRATVVQEIVKVHSGPSKDFPNLFDLPLGIEVETLNQSEDWVQISSPDGSTGWVPTKTLIMTSGS